MFRAVQLSWNQEPSDIIRWRFPSYHLYPLSRNLLWKVEMKNQDMPVFIMIESN